MRKLHIVSIVIVLVGTFGFLAKPLVSSSNSSKLEHIKTLTLKIPENLDASKTISYNSILLVDNLFPRLFRISENLQFEGEVAKDWKVNQAKNIITVTIDSTAKFSDGSPITTQDIVLSFNKIFDANSIPGFFFKNIKGVKALNQSQVEVQYLGWDVTALNQLGSPFLAIYKNGKAPYQNNLRSWIISSRYSIKSWNQEALVLEVYGKSVKTLSILPLEKVGDTLSSLDLMISRVNWISPETITSQINEKFTTYVFDSFNTSLVMSNIRLPSGHRKCLATNSLQDKELSRILGDARLKSVLPASMFSYDPDIKLSNVTKPKQKKFFTLMVQSPDGLAVAAIKRLVAVADQCNITLQVEDLDNANYIDRLLKHDFDFAYVTISVLYNDPYFVFSFFHKKSKFNFTGSTAQLSQLIDRYSESRTQQETLEKSKVLQRKLLQEGIAIPLVTVKSMSFVRKPLVLKGHSLFDVVRWEDVL